MIETSISVYLILDNYHLYKNFVLLQGISKSIYSLWKTVLFSSQGY